MAIQTRDPTPSEIAALCLEFQAGWDDGTRTLRMVGYSRNLSKREVREGERLVRDLAFQRLQAKNQAAERIWFS